MKFHRIGADYGFCIFLFSSEWSRVRIFVFAILIEAERSSEFCFGLNSQSGADLFLYFQNLSGQNGLRSNEICQIKAVFMNVRCVFI